jgi:hypothetical protein
MSVRWKFISVNSAFVCRPDTSSGLLAGICIYRTSLTRLRSCPHPASPPSPIRWAKGISRSHGRGNVLWDVLPRAASALRPCPGLLSFAPPGLSNSRQFVKWTRSRPLARPSRAFGFAKFLSPLPKRFKSCHSSRLGVFALKSAVFTLSRWWDGFPGRGTAFPVVGRLSRMVGRGSRPFCRRSRSK